MSSLVENDADKMMDLAFDAARGSLVEAVLNNELVPVPSISQAVHFSLFAVFIKDKKANFLDKLKKEVPVYRLIGHLNDIIQLDRTNVDRLLNSAESHTEDCAHIDKSKRWEGDVNLQTLSVHLTFDGLTKLLVPITVQQGDLYLKMNIPELASARSMYIITDVMKAYQVTAVGFDDDDFCLRKTCNNVTVGFQYSKFRLTSEGQVAEQMKTKTRLDGRWVVAGDEITHYLNNL